MQAIGMTMVLFTPTAPPLGHLPIFMLAMLTFKLVTAQAILETPYTYSTELEQSQDYVSHGDEATGFGFDGDYSSDELDGISRTGYSTIAAEVRSKNSRQRQPLRPKNTRINGNLRKYHHPTQQFSTVTHSVPKINLPANQRQYIPSTRTKISPGGAEHTSKNSPGYQQHYLPVNDRHHQFQKDSDEPIEQYRSSKPGNAPAYFNGQYDASYSNAGNFENSKFNGFKEESLKHGITPRTKVVQKLPIVQHNPWNGGLHGHEKTADDALSSKHPIESQFQYNRNPTKQEFPDKTANSEVRVNQWPYSTQVQNQMPARKNDEFGKSDDDDIYDNSYSTLPKHLRNFQHPKSIQEVLQKIKKIPTKTIVATTVEPVTTQIPTTTITTTPIIQNSHTESKDSNLNQQLQHNQVAINTQPQNPQPPTFENNPVTFNTQHHHPYHQRNPYHQRYPYHHRNPYHQRYPYHQRNPIVVPTWYHLNSIPTLPAFPTASAIPTAPLNPHITQPPPSHLPPSNPSNSQIPQTNAIHISHNDENGITNHVQTNYPPKYESHNPGNSDRSILNAMPFQRQPQHYHREPMSVSPMSLMFGGLGTMFSGSWDTMETLIGSISLFLYVAYYMIGVPLKATLGIF